MKGARIVIAPKSPALAAAEWLAGHGRSLTPVSVGIEPESITAGMRNRLASTLKGRARLRFTPPLIERARMVKDAAEIRRIRRAVELGASLFRVACRKIRPGVSELEVAAAMEYEARCARARGMSFPTIMASGTRSAIVHGRASELAYPAARVRGMRLWCYTRRLLFRSHAHRACGTAFAAKPETLWSGAGSAAVGIAAVRPGRDCREVDGAARLCCASENWPGTLPIRPGMV